MRHVVIDIETIPDPDLPWTGDPDHFASPPHWKVVCLGVLVLEDWRPTQMHALTGDEASILRRFSHAMQKHGGDIVTWNGRGFDLPVILARSLKQRVQMPWYFDRRGMRYRYSGDGHVDLCDELCDHGAGRRWSLDAAAKLIGWPGKIDTDGSMVPDLYASGDLGRIANYCLEDVVQTAAVLLEFAHQRGQDTAENEAHVAALREFVMGDQRVTHLIEKAAA